MLEFQCLNLLGVSAERIKHIVEEVLSNRFEKSENASCELEDITEVVSGEIRNKGEYMSPNQMEKLLKKRLGKQKDTDVKTIKGRFVHFSCSVSRSIFQHVRRAKTLRKHAYSNILKIFR